MDTLHVAAVKAIFREHGLAPKKWMGQNLIVDGRYLKDIVHHAKIRPDEPILEIGAGLGTLTEELVIAGARVWALELDSGFYRMLEERFRDEPRITPIHADALSYDFASLAQSVGKLRVVANLPYSISSRLLFSMCEQRVNFRSLHILLQKEVAERLIAEPGHADYGVLTVILNAVATTEILFDIPPKAFYPVPDVTSSLVHVAFPDNPPVHVDDFRLFTLLAKCSFHARRKTLRNNLRQVPVSWVTPELIADAAQRADIDLGLRGETLSAARFAVLANKLLELKPSELSA